MASLEQFAWWLQYFICKSAISLQILDELSTATAFFVSIVVIILNDIIGDLRCSFPFWGKKGIFGVVLCRDRS